MKKRHRSTIAATFLATALLAIGALPALADNPLDILSNVIADQNANQQFTLTVNPYPNPPNEQGGGFFVGLTTGVLTDTATGATSDPFYMFCVDFNDEIQPQVTYNTIVESLVGPLTPDATPIGETLPTLQLQAILGSDFGVTPSGNAAYDTEVQDDIWNLDNHSANLPGDTHNQLINAQAAYAAGQNYSNAYIFDIQPQSPGNPNGPGQAFMPVAPGGFNNSNQPPAPEPGTLVMLGLGLLGLGSMKLRRSRR